MTRVRRYQVRRPEAPGVGVVDRPLFDAGYLKQAHDYGIREAAGIVSRRHVGLTASHWR